MLSIVSSSLFASRSTYSRLLSNYCFRGYAKEAASGGSGGTAGKAKAKASASKKKKGAAKVVPKKKAIRVSKSELRKRSVILTQTTPGLGDKGEEIKVARGFARNYLIPNNLAVLPTLAAKDFYAEDAAKIDYHERARQKSLADQKKRIGKVMVIIKRHEIAPSVPIHPVSKEQVCEKLWKQFQIELAPENLGMRAPVKVYGKQEFPVTVEGTTGVTLKINVMKR